MNTLAIQFYEKGIQLTNSDGRQSVNAACTGHTRPKPRSQFPGLQFPKLKRYLSDLTSVIFDWSHRHSPKIKKYITLISYQKHIQEYFHRSGKESKTVRSLEIPGRISCSFAITESFRYLTSQKRLNAGRHGQVLKPLATDSDTVLQMLGLSGRRISV